MTTPVLIERSPSYRTLINRTMINALRSVFTVNYKDPLMASLKITTKYPLKAVEYPSLVFEYEGSGIYNAGVGHEEWFDDAQGILRKWHHRRFEGTALFNLYALSPLDRDILADALIETLCFGRLDSALLPFFTTIYGDPTAAFDMQTMFNQLALNIDEIDEEAASATIAPWQPEDVLVYSISYSCGLHGGFYNSVPGQTYPKVIKVAAQSYPQFNVEVDGTFQTVPPVDPYPGAEWTNPFEYVDGHMVKGVADLVVIGGSFEEDPEDIAGMIIGVAVISAVEEHAFNDSMVVSGVAVGSAVDVADFVDAGTAIGIGIASPAADSPIYVDETRTASGIAVVSGVEVTIYVVEVTTATGVAVPSASDSQFLVLTTTGAE